MTALNKHIAKTLQGISEGIRSGSFGKRPRIALTIPGSEHGEDELIGSAKLAKANYSGFDVILIGTSPVEGFECHEAGDLESAHHVMEDMFDKGTVDASVTLHYNFPLGVSTVGKVVTPGFGRDMILATTTGTSDPARNISMVKNAICGIILARSLGMENPSLGVLNVEGSSAVVKALDKLKSGGFPINYAQSARADGGVIMRGNDLLQGTPDIMVADTLTGNLLIKMFASFTTGGGYEGLGYGYGPAIGEGFPHIVSIISRASGAPVIANAIKMTADAVTGGIREIAEEMFARAKQAGLEEISESLKPKSINADSAENESVTQPPEKIASEELTGIDILQIEDAKVHLWKNGIFAKTGMGCTGPVVMVAGEDKENSRILLENEGYI